MSGEELAAWLRLLLTPGVGTDSARKLLAAFGLPDAIFGQSTSALQAVVGSPRAQALLTEPDDLPAALQRLQAWLAAGSDRHVLTLADKRFPAELLDAPQSKGCHALIRQGAKLVESANDILEDLRLPTGTASPMESPEHDRDDDLLEAIGHDPVSLDALQARTGLDTATLQARLLELELEGQVGRLPGGLLQRLNRA